MTEMNLCPYCGKLAGLVTASDRVNMHNSIEIKRCIYCGEEVCDVTEALSTIEELTEKLDVVMKELWTQSCKLEDVEAFRLT